MNTIIENIAIFLGVICLMISIREICFPNCPDHQERDLAMRKLRNMGFSYFVCLIIRIAHDLNNIPFSRITLQGISPEDFEIF